MVTLLERDPRLHSRQLQEMFQVPVLNLGDIMSEEQYRKINGNFRSDCKEKLSIMVQYLLRLSGEPESMIRRKLYRYYVQQYYSDE